MKKLRGTFQKRSYPGALARSVRSIGKLRCIGLCLGIPALYLSDGGRALAQSEPIYWPRLEFVIPFQIDNNGSAPREVLLEVSEDTGQNWSLCSRGDTRTRQFQYKAPQDGEYVFRLKTVDNSGRRFDNPGEPLRIIIDTIKPTANLIVDMDPQGDMVAEFLVSDTALDVASLSLEFQTEVSQDWTPISFQLSRSTTPGEYAGSGGWKLPHDAKQLVVRLVAKDKAGNSVEVTRLPALPKTASGPRGLQFASQPVTLPNSPFADRSNVPSQSTPLLADSNLGMTQRAKLNPPALSPPSQSSAGSGSSGTERNSEAVKGVIQSPAIVLGPLPNKLNQRGLPIRELSDSEIDAIRNRDGFRLTGSSGNQSLLMDASVYDNANGNLPSGRDNNVRGSGGRGDDLSVLVKSPVATGATPLPKTPSLGAPRNVSSGQPEIAALYSNTRAFSLDYRIENDPGAPITEVELWGTVDQGRTWEVWGQDPDRTSPFDIEVETDGLFGFRMVIVGANGLASNRPRNGDNADAWIHVDTQKPQVRISSALYGTGKEAGSLVIEYQAADEFFGDRPISLHYAESPAGPWETISTGIRNQGRFVWPSNPSLPPVIFLKIDAIDTAGNVASYVLDAPVNVEGIAPRGKIQGFRPLSRP